VSNKAVFPQQFVTVIFVQAMYNSVSLTRCASLLYQLPFCTGLALLSLQHRGCTGAWELNLQKLLQMAVLKKFHKTQPRPTCNKYHVKTVCLAVLAAQLSQAVTAGGILWDTINGPDRSVY